MNRETVLPKNIRQIGEIQQDKKVYLEDYVITFIRRKEKERGEKNCSGVLLGTIQQEGEDSFVFVRGALVLDDQEEDPQKRWKLMEEEKEKNFQDVQMIGCFILGVLEEPYILEMMEMLPQPPFLIFHIQEGEETVYWSRENQYEKLKGFFIFYERNPQMQKYMAEHCEPRKVEKEEGNSDEAIVNFRKKVAEKGRLGKGGGMRYLASSFLVLTIFILGVTIINNYDKMKRIEETMSRLAEEQEEQNQAVVVSGGAQAAGDQGDGTLTDGEGQETDTERTGEESAQREAEAASGQNVTADGAAGGNSPSDLTSEETEEPADQTSEVSSKSILAEGAGETSQQGETAGDREEASKAQEEDDSLPANASGDLTDFADSITSQALQERNYSAEDPDQTVETEPLGKTDEVQEAASRQNRTVYTIRYGDTLADISAKYYGSLDKVEEICQLNGIDDANMIVPGEKIVLP